MDGCGNTKQSERHHLRVSGKFNGHLFGLLPAILLLADESFALHAVAQDQVVAAVVNRFRRVLELQCQLVLVAAVPFQAGLTCQMNVVANLSAKRKKLPIIVLLTTCTGGFVYGTMNHGHRCHHDRAANRQSKHDFTERECGALIAIH